MKKQEEHQLMSHSCATNKNQYKNLIKINRKINKNHRDSEHTLHAGHDRAHTHTPCGHTSTCHMQEFATIARDSDSLDLCTMTRLLQSSEITPEARLTDKVAYCSTLKTAESNPRHFNTRENFNKNHTHPEQI